MNRKLARSLSIIITVLWTCHMQVVAQSTQNFDLRDVEIVLKRENRCGCVPMDDNDLSCCPVYSVSVRGDGTVVYDGVAGVKIKGKHVYAIPTEEVRKLVDEFYRIKFFSLQDRYTTKPSGDGLVRSTTHSNATTLSITTGGKTKSIYNFYGAPEALLKLENMVDEVTGARRYTGRGRPRS